MSGHGGDGAVAAIVSCSRRLTLAAEVPSCANIRTLFNFEPPATEEEIRAASVQFVRKISGSTKPSRANEDAFERAVDEVSEAAGRLLSNLVTSAPPRNRETEAAKARGRTAKRFPR